MLQFIKPLTCLSRSKPVGKCGAGAAGELDECVPSAVVEALRPRARAAGRRPRKIARGFALLIVMVAAAVLLIGLTAVLPSIYQEGQREREAELIFRGKQYARAIAGYHQKFQRYPTSIQDLTKLTNGFRFLRKEYADPMTPGGKWRYIHANAQGVLLDSLTQGGSPGGQGQGQTGSGQGAGGLQSNLSSAMGMAGSGLGPQAAAGGGFDQQAAGASGFGPQSAGGSGFGPQGGSGSGFGSQGFSGTGSGSSSSFSSNSTSGGSTSNTQQGSGFSMGSSQGGGTFIVGVASTSHKQSIRIWNQKTHYHEWEFIGIDLGALGIATSIPGLPQGTGTQSNQGNQQNGFGPSNQGNQQNGFGPSNQGNQQGGFGQPNQGNTTGPGQNQSGFSSSDGSGTSGSNFSPQ